MLDLQNDQQLLVVLLEKGFWKEFQMNELLIVNLILLVVRRKSVKELF
jgi:hypothetical protein